MKVTVAFFFCCAILSVFGDEEPSVHDNVSQEDQETLNNILDFMACVDEGKCDPSEQNIEKDFIPDEDVEDSNHEVPLEPVTEVGIEPNHPEVSDEKSSYFYLCERFHLRLEELELHHPELRMLKLEFLERLNVHASKFTTECKDGESIVLKFLDLIIFVANELKEDFAYLEHREKDPVVEIIAEENDYHEIGFVGSLRGIPGVDFPNYTEIPITSFSCAGKKIPGFYADLETGCQVFHVCYEHRRESFLCPIGTIFNQPILACDYWYSANCSLTPLYEDVIIEKPIPDKHIITEEVIETILEEPKPSEEELEELVKFLPVKAKIIEFPKEPEGKPVISTIVGVEEVATKILGEVITTTKIVPKPQVVKVVPEVVKPILKPKVVEFVPEVVKPVLKPQVVKVVPEVVKPVLKPQVVEVIPKFVKPVPEVLVPVFPTVVNPFPFKKVKLSLKSNVIPMAKLVKAKVSAAAAVPVVKAKVAAAAAVPVVKAKVAAAAAVPVVKAKVAAAAAVPVVKAKVAAAAAVPVVKAKVAAAAAVPVVKTKVGAAKIPLVKAKFITAAAVPVSKAKLLKAAAPFYKVKASSMAKSKLVKAKLAAVPVVKVKKTAKIVPVAKVAVKSKFVVPFVKAKLVKPAVISPLTKKALSVGFLKLMKAKKLALLG